MYIDNAEAAYLMTRIEASQDMAASARVSCARLVHEELAGRYRGRLAALLRSVVPVAISVPIIAPARVAALL
jgi:hypothetical protein